MKLRMFFSLFTCTVMFSSCGSFLSPAGWPVEVEARSKKIEQMVDHVRFTGSTKTLRKEEKALLVFLEDPKNVADAIGKKNKEGSHEWSAAEVYLVERGKHVSVLCENGYEQKAVYFHYSETEKTWYRVSHLGPDHSKGVAAVIVK